jgi:hypothetical protein
MKYLDKSAKFSTGKIVYTANGCYDDNHVNVSHPFGFGCIVYAIILIAIVSILLFQIV